MKFNKMMVALDQSNMDENLIRYSHFITETCGLKSIFFVHVVSDATSPENLVYSYENIIEKDPLLLEKRKKKLEKRIKPVFDTLKGIDLNFVTMEGNPRKEIIQKILEENIDLLVVGKKQLSSGSGVKARRIAQKAKSAVWFVTEKATTDIQKILVPVDFSDNSLRALKTALDLKAQLNEVAINIIHVIDIPRTAYKINQNRDAIISELKASAVNSLLQFLSQNQLDRNNIGFTVRMNDEFSVAHYIQEIASQEKSDLIIIGGKGHSRFENFLFGSVTEKLVTYEYGVPILVVR